MNILKKVVVLSRCVQAEYELFLGSFNTVCQLNNNKATVADERTVKNRYFKIFDHWISEYLRNNTPYAKKNMGCDDFPSEDEKINI